MLSAQLSQDIIKFHKVLFAIITGFTHIPLSRELEE